ncbi:hypothetical protein KR038_006822 [Drosophila bunnanda]|nr:hypothetical protein KR038_006822 [Drosophila bunnanda]
MASRCNILNLPVEVLNLVYKSIPNMRDKLNLAKAHDFLGKVFAIHAGDAFKSIEIEERPIKDWSDILLLCGSSVTRILTRAVNTTVIVVKLASMYCPKLEEFFIPVRSNFWNHIKPLLLSLENVSWIGLMNKYEKANVVDTLLQMPKLKSLQLIGFNREDWQRVGELVNLTSLTIMNKKEEPIDIFKVCSPMKNMDSMELQFASIRMPKDYGGEQLWPKIELLSISYGVFHTSLPYLPTLKYLTLDSIDPYINLTDVFGQSVFNYGNTLESLRFCPGIPRLINADDLSIIMKLKALKRLGCQVGSDYVMDYITFLKNLDHVTLDNSYITNRGVMMLVYRCKKLRHLSLFGCPMVNSDFVIEAFLYLKTLRPKLDNPVEFRVSPWFGYVDKVI